MTPIDNLLKFVADCRAIGMPDAVIYKGLQLAILEATQLEFAQTSRSTASRPTPSPSNKVGFI